MEEAVEEMNRMESMPSPVQRRDEEASGQRVSDAPPEEGSRCGAARGAEEGSTGGSGDRTSQSRFQLRRVPLRHLAIQSGWYLSRPGSLACWERGSLA